MTLPHGARAWRFDDVAEGEVFGPLPWVVDDHAVKAYAFAVDDYRPWYSGAGTFSGAVAPPLALGNPLLRIYKTRYGEPGDRVLHTRNVIHWRRPLLVGETVELHGQYVQREVRRGGGYVVLEGTAVAADGSTVLTQRATEMTPLRRAAPDDAAPRTGTDSRHRITGVLDASVAPAVRAADDVAVGTPLPQLQRQIHQDQVTVFSADGYLADLHTSPVEAARFGFRLPVLQGLHQAAVLADLLASFFGPPLLSGGTLDVRFIKPVMVGAALTAQGVVTGRATTAVGTRLAVDVWVRDAEGDLATVGTASAPLGRGGCHGND